MVKLRCMATSMDEYSYNDKQQKHKSNGVPLRKIVLVLVLFFWLSTHFDIARDLCREFIAVSNKPLPIFIFMNFIIFALCFLSSQKQSKRPLLVYHENVGSNRGNPDVGDCLPEEEHSEGMFVDKHIILVENAGREIVAVSSENYESLERNHGQLEFRRSERGMSKELVITTREPPWRSMDVMSNEEFRFAVEAFVAERNRVMMHKNVHDKEGIRFLISTSD